MERFKVSTVSAKSVGSGPGKFRRPVHVRVMDLGATVVSASTRSAWHVSRGEGDIVEEWSDVDSRYSGPRSAYGQSLDAATACAAELNAATH